MKTLMSSLMLFSVVLVSVAYGHSDAVGIVKERMDAMSAMSEKSKLVGSMVKGKLEFRREAFGDAADAFVYHGSQMAGLFPNTEESTSGKHTEALPLIWEEWDDFESRVEEFVVLSESFKELVSETEDRNRLKKAFIATAKSCSGCHKKYRKPKG